MNHTETQPNLLKLAKQGNPKAIAALMNRQLQPKGITAQAELKDGCLQIILESAQVPNQPALVAFVRKGIMGLGAASIERTKVYGQQAGNQIPAWSQEFELIKQPLPSIEPVTEESVIPNQEMTPTQPLSQDTQNRAKEFFNQGLAKSKGRNLEAIKDFSQAIYLNPNHAEAWFMRGSNYLAFKLYECALHDFNRAIKLKSDYGQAYYERGLTYGALNNYQKAVEDYSQALLLNITYDSLYNNRGDAYQRLECYTEALNDFNQAIHLNPNETLYSKNREIVLQKMKGVPGTNSNFAVVNKTLNGKDNKQTLNEKDNKQSCLGCLILIFFAFVIMSALGKCSSGSSNTSTSIKSNTQENIPASVKPSSTATEEPSSTATEEPSSTAIEEKDRRFLAAIDSSASSEAKKVLEQIPDYKKIAFGKEACQSFSEGMSFEDFALKVALTYGNNSTMAEIAGRLVGAGVGAYCPEYSYKVQ